MLGLRGPDHLLFGFSCLGLFLSVFFVDRTSILVLNIVKGEPFVRMTATCSKAKAKAKEKARESASERRTLEQMTAASSVSTV